MEDVNIEFEIDSESQKKLFDMFKQESERGQQYEENADDLETACDDLENLIESIQEVINR